MMEAYKQRGEIIFKLNDSSQVSYNLSTKESIGKKGDL